MKTESEVERRTAIHLLRSGKTSQEAAKDLERSPAWVRKWCKRFQEAGWDGLQSRSRAPQHSPHQLPQRVRQAIRRVRSELEAEARKPGKLSYVGSHAIRARLQRKHIQPLPGISSIERELRSAGMTRPWKLKQAEEIQYPHIHPRDPHQLTQVDIFPKYLSGGKVWLASMPLTWCPAIRAASSTPQNAPRRPWISWCTPGKRWASPRIRRSIMKAVLAAVSPIPMYWDRCFVWVYMLEQN